MNQPSLSTKEKMMKKSRFSQLFIINLFFILMLSPLNLWSNADLSITKTVDNSTPAEGDVVIFTIVGTNNGSDSSEFNITDTLPDGLTFDTSYSGDGVDANSIGFSCSTSGQTATCEGDRNFLADQNVTVTIHATVTQSGTITNTASITSENNVSDANGSNNTASATVRSLPYGGEANGICYGKTVEAGDKITTEINSIEDNLTNVTVYFDTSSLFSSSMFGSTFEPGFTGCSVDNGDKGENCQKHEDGMNFGPMSIFNKGGWTFDLGSTSKDDNHSISTYQNNSFFSKILDMFSSEGALMASYEKDGKLYRGELQQCGGSSQSNSSPSGVFNLIETNTILSGEDPIDGADHKNDIYTKVINQDFNISLVHLNDDNVTVKNSFNGFVSIDIIDSSDNILQEDVWHHSFVSTISNTSPSGQYQINNLHLNIIGKNVKFKIYYIDWDQLLDNNSTIKCVNRSTTQGNLPGVPSCLDNKSNLKAKFPSVAKYCLDENATGAPCNSSNHGRGNSPYDKADAGKNKGYGCALCLLGGGNSAYSRDNFAIRPYSFRAFGKNQYKLAGEDFNITVKAVDEGNNSLNSGTVSDVTGVSDYNASLSDLNIASNFYQPSTADIRQMNNDVYDINDTNSSRVTNCPNAGTFTINNSSDSFVSGEGNASLKFSETGILDLNISEKPGHEWALVDADDTNDSQRYIKPATAIYDDTNISATNLLLFAPYKFDTTAEYNTTNGKNWLYMHNINGSNHTFTTPKMAAFIKYTITAKNKDGAVTHNYTKSCFPDTSETNCPRVNGLKLNTTFDLFLDADINSSADANISLYSEDNNSNGIWVLHPNKSISEGNNSVQEWIGPKNFENGVGKAKVYFNIDRNVSKTRNPMTIRVIDANTSTSWMNNLGSPKEFHGSDINTSKIFYYGRTHAPRATIRGSDGNVSIYYEVFCNGAACHKSLLQDGNNSTSTDDPRWFVNTKHTQTSGTAGTTTQKNATNVSVTREANGNHPDYIGLQYNESRGYPYKTTMENNASDWLIYNKYNPDATKNEFEVEFINPNTNWAGVHEANATTNKNASDNTNRRLMW